MTWRNVMHLETTMDHLNSFLAPLNHLLCPFLPIALEMKCLSSILFSIRCQNGMDTKNYSWEPPWDLWTPSIILCQISDGPPTPVKWPVRQCVGSNILHSPILRRSNSPRNPQKVTTILSPVPREHRGLLAKPVVNQGRKTSADKELPW